MGMILDGDYYESLVYISHYVSNPIKENVITAKLKYIYIYIFQILLPLIIPKGLFKL